MNTAGSFDFSHANKTAMRSTLILVILFVIIIVALMFKKDSKSGYEPQEEKPEAPPVKPPQPTKEDLVPNPFRPHGLEETGAMEQATKVEFLRMRVRELEALAPANSVMSADLQEAHRLLREANAASAKNTATSFYRKSPVVPNYIKIDPFGTNSIIAGDPMIGVPISSGTKRVIIQPAARIPDPSEPNQSRISRRNRK